MKGKIKARLEQGVYERVFPGAVVGVVEKSGERAIVAVGKFTYDSDAPSVTDDTVYDTASITKSVPVALLVWWALERNLLSLDDPVTKYIPEITIPDADKGRIRHLLTYTYYLQKNPDPNFSYARYSARDIFEFLYTRPFAFLPGTQYQYSNTPTNLLGIILERITKKKLYELAQEIILDPLQMTSATFHPSDPTHIPPTEIVDWRGVVQGVVHDETAYLLQKEGYDAGCAGLFSNADDLLNPIEMILNGGIFKTARICELGSIVGMSTNALDVIAQWSGIGWELNQPRFMGAYSHEHMMGKTGFTGTCMIIDLKRQRGFVMLSNRTYPTRPENADAIVTVRRDLADIIFAP